VKGAGIAGVPGFTPGATLSILNPIMAILKIARMGHPVLARKADPVPDPTHPEIRRLVRDMIDTMRDADGTGLAAPQVHVPLRVVVFFVEGERAARESNRADEASQDEASPDEEGGVPLTVMVNPVIEPLGPEQALGWEACLSVPDLAGRVARFTRIRYRFQDLEGRQHERIAEDFHARVVQHECDHLEGKLYPQRMTDMGTLVFASEMRHQGEAEVRD
jgi:peptide deformylase